MANLFSQAQAATQASSSGKVLVAFRAGKMTVGANNLVTADPRRGKIEVRQGTDQLMHFQWRDRQTGDLVDDLMIFPEEAHLKKLKQVKDGRVLLLEFQGSDRRLFFWMQEPSADRDAEFVSKVNEMLNNPPTPGMDDADTIPTDLSQLPPHLLQQLQAMGPGGMEQAQQLIQMLNAQRQLGGQGGNGGSSRGSRNPAATPKAAAPKASAQPKTPSVATPTGPTRELLAGILGGLETTPQQQRPQSMARVMDAEAVLPLLLSDASLAAKLLEFLPEGQQTMQELHALPHSGQWQRFLDTFGSALQSGELRAVLVEMGLGDLQPASAVRGPTLEAFFEALQKKHGGN